MKDLLVITVVVLGVTLTGAQTYYDCSESSLKSCLGDMVEVAQSSQEGTVPSYTPEEFKRVCKEYEASRTCLSSIRDYCTSEEQSQLDSIGAMFGYLCEDGFQVFVENSDCFLDANKTLSPLLDKCLATYERSTKALLQGRGSASERLRRLCRYTNMYVKCSGDHTRSQCGQDAGELVIEMSKRVFNVVFDQLSFDCDINSSTAARWSYMTLVVTIFLFLKNIF